jgi:DNA-binding CsgD family transcriptional regulator
MTQADGQPRVLIGRDPESRVLADLLEAVRGGQSRSLVLVGEAGIGKTALLDRLAGQAGDVRVLRVAGVEAERELAFAAVHQLFSTSTPQVDRLPAPQRAAVRTAFGLDGGSVADRFTIAVGILTLVSDLARERPVLCIVDDEQWVDRASLRVLTFVARRLGSERVGLVFASRVASSELRTLPTLRVDGLPRHDAGTLLDSALTGRLDPRVRSQVISETHGNPLALLELPRGATPAELAGGFALPGVLALSHRIEATYRRQLQRVPAPARQWLVIAAADPLGDPATLWSATEGAGLDSETAAAAIGTGLVEVDTTVRFRHPLARSAVYRAADLDQRRAAHRALAAATDPGVDPDRRAWHRAQAAATPAEDVAAELEAAAARARARGGYTASSAFLERSAALTPDRAERARRLLAAAEANWDAGTLPRALELLDAAEVVPDDDLHRGRVLRIRGQVSLELHRPRQAVDNLLAAADLLVRQDPDDASATYLEALFAAIWAGEHDGWDIARVANAIPRDATSSDLLVDLVLRGLRTRVIDGYAAAVPLLRSALAAVSADPSYARLGLFRAGLSLAMDLWEDRSWRLLSRRFAATARDHGALTTLMITLRFSAFNQIAEGDLAGAEHSLAEVREITAALGATHNVNAEVVLAAWRGDEERTLALSAEVRHLDTGGLMTKAVNADHADAVVHNANGRFDAALAAARRAFAREPYPIGPLVVSELADAASRTGETDELRRAAGWLAVRERAAPGDWVHGVSERVRGLMSTDTAAEPHYRASIEHLSRTLLRAELARSQLAYGEWLRRQGRRGDARRQLQDAHELFDGMGAAGFAARATRELQAAGYGRLERTSESTVTLTAQEAQVAALARAGLTNPEIGQRLFISPRTVQYHLRKVFIKLGITSREHLAHTDLPDADLPHPGLPDPDG